MRCPSRRCAACVGGPGAGISETPGRPGGNVCAARAKELGDDDLAQIAPNASAGRVATLLVEADRVVPGVSTVTGEIVFAELTDPDVNDITPRCELSKCSSGGLADARFLPNDGGLADRG